MTKDQLTLEIFAVIGSISISALIVVGAIWLINMTRRWMDR